MEVAIELGTELGADGLTMRRIAARLGVSATVLYQHFEGKGSILQAIRLHGLTLLNTVVAPAFDAEDPIEQIRQSTLRYIDFARSNPWLYALLFHGEDFDLETCTAEQRESILFSTVAVKAAVERGKESGQLRADLDVKASSYLIWASNHGMSMLLITGRISDKHPSLPASSVDDLITRFVEAEIRGLTPGASQNPAANECGDTDGV